MIVGMYVVAYMLTGLLIAIQCERIPSVSERLDGGGFIGTVILYPFIGIVLLLYVLSCTRIKFYWEEF